MKSGWPGSFLSSGPRPTAESRRKNVVFLAGYFFGPGPVKIWYPAGTQLVPAGTSWVPAGTSWVPAGPGGTGWVPAGTSWVPAGTSWYQLRTGWYPAGTGWVPAGTSWAPLFIFGFGPCWPQHFFLALGPAEFDFTQSRF